MLLMLKLSDFNLRHTIESGQPLTFYSQYSSGNGTESLSYVTSRGVISISIRDSALSYSFEGDYNRKSAKGEVVRRLALDDDMRDIYEHINTDGFIGGAIEGFRGMRITRNDPWETTLCFLISQFNNIKRIRHIMHRMIAEFGYEFDNKRLFPVPEAVAAAETSRIRGCGTGFRDKYIKSVAEQYAHSFDPEKLYGMKYETAKEKLMELDGIGDKVADCILLFGYNKMEAFPIDLWVKRVMENVYFNGRKKTVKRIHEFSERRWGKEYLGYAQQYIYWAGRENKVGVIK